MKQIIALILCTSLALLVPNVSAAAIPGFNECMVNGRFYEIGESFHPIVTVRGREYEGVCYNCTCLLTTIAHCEEVYCPQTDCPVSFRLNGTCCPVCLTTGSEMPAGPKQCLFEGLSIPHGEVFHPPSMLETFDKEMEGNGSTSGENITVNPFCTLCECKDGEVECTDVSSTCPPLTCNYSQALLIDGSCCMVCPTAPTPTSEPTSLKACTDNLDGMVHSHGDSWNPVHPEFGRVECTLCTCTNGSIHCAQEPCPEVPLCGPNEPFPDVVICCLKCKPRTYNPVVTASPTPQPTTTEMVAVTTPLPITPPCNTKSYIINIFKHTSADSLAVENTNTQSVDIYSWTLTETGELMKNIVSVTSLHFREMSDYDNFAYVGKTLLRRVNGLTTRESKRDRIRRCMRNCSSLVVNMLRPVTGECTDQN